MKDRKGKRSPNFFLIAGTVLEFLFYSLCLKRNK